MKIFVLWTSLWLGIFSGVALAEGVEREGSKCQKLAHEFADNPNSLNEMQLTQLQFCVTQTIEQRYKTNPPELLRGTIIDPPVSSDAPDMKTPAPSQHPGGQQ